MSSNASAPSRWRARWLAQPRADVRGRGAIRVRVEPTIMPPNHRRADRVAESIREEVATFLHEGAKDPRLVGLVTVTAVDVTRDLRSARIYVSILGSDSERMATVDALTSMT